MGANQITHLTFLDIETTAKYGPDTRLDAIVEVAVSRVCLADRAVVDSFQALVKPWGDQALSLWPGEPNPISWDLGDFHLKAGHFTGVDFQTQGLDYDLILDILADRFLIDGATLAGQNPPFDRDHLFRDMASKGMKIPRLDYHLIDLCSPAIFLVMSGATDGVGLRKTGPWAGCPPQRHRAGPDVEDAIQVFWAMFDHFTGRDPKVDAMGLIQNCDAALCPNRD